MSDNTRRIEKLEGHDGNPLDELMFWALDYARAVYFYCNRHRNKIFSEDVSIQSKKDIEQMQEKINELIEFISTLSDEELESVRATARVHTDTDITSFSYTLYQQMVKLPTIYTDSIPYAGKGYELLRYGEDSDIYKRYKYLREVVDSNTAITRNVLHHCIDIIERGDEHCKKSFGFSDKDCEISQLLISSYNLTEDDCEYMQSYIRMEYPERPV